MLFFSFFGRDCTSSFVVRFLVTVFRNFDATLGERLIIVEAFAPLVTFLLGHIAFYAIASCPSLPSPLKRCDKIVSPASIILSSLSRGLASRLVICYRAFFMEDDVSSIRDYLLDVSYCLVRFLTITLMVDSLFLALGLGYAV